MAETINKAQLDLEAIAGGRYYPVDYQPVVVVSTLPATAGYAGPSIVFLTTDSKIYRYNSTNSTWTKVVEASDIDARNLSILDSNGVPVFGADGQIGNTAYLNINGNNVQLSSLAAASLVPALNFVGSYSSAPTQAQLGPQWIQNSVYRNTVDGLLYVLTGTPLGWVVYLEDGTSFVLTIESTNGTVFRVGQSKTTLLKGRLFKNGAEVTDQTPAGWFRWRRVSAVPREAPNDDTTWNNLYTSGYKQVSINVDDVYARATFFCDVISQQ